MKTYPWLTLPLIAAAFFLAGMAWRQPQAAPAPTTDEAVREHPGVTGIGGVFFKAREPKKLREWYRQHLGMTPSEHGSVMFEWREADDPDKMGQTVWGPFPETTRYFDPSTAPFMINYRVADLDELLRQLREAEVWVDERLESYDYGRFAWIMDPEGNRIELWEPAAPPPR